MTGRRRNPVKTLFKVETLSPNSILVIKQGSALDTPAQMKKLANEMLKRDLGSILVFRLGSLDDLCNLTEKDMGNYGWVKKAEVSDERPK